MGAQIVHGTWMAYNKRKCRCDLCRALMREYSRQYSREYRAAHPDLTERRRERGLPVDDPRHGTEAGYTHGGCRCDKCREGYADIRKARRAARRAAATLADDDPRHGRVSTYANWGCRCDACKSANTARSTQQRARLRGSGPTVTQD